MCLAGFLSWMWKSSPSGVLVESLFPATRPLGIPELIVVFKTAFSFSYAVNVWVVKLSSMRFFSKGTSGVIGASSSNGMGRTWSGLILYKPVKTSLKRYHFLHVGSSSRVSSQCNDPYH